jgi:PAS domain S-box-containing protein
MKQRAGVYDLFDDLKVTMPEVIKKPKTLILVDDDPGVTGTLRNLVEMETNWKVCEFNNPYHAIDYIENNDVALVLCDYLMPGMNGIEALRRIREIRPGASLMILTAYADKEGAVKAINEVGLDYYFEKPWDNEDIISVLKHFVKYKDSLENYAIQAELAEERDFSETIVRTAQALIVVLDSDGRIRTFNKKCQEVTGYSESDVLGRKIWDIFLPQSDSEILQEMFRDLESNLRTTFENTWLTKDGKERTIVWNNALIRKTTKALLVVATGEDVTDRRIIEAGFRQAHKMDAVGTLASGIAHDFNNILTGILGNTALAKMLTPEGSKIHQLLHQVEEAAESAAELTRQLLGFSRKQRPDFGPTDVNKAVGKIVRLVRRSISENIEIETELEGPIPIIRADTGQLEQVLLNMAINARDAMPEGGHLIFKTKIAKVDETFVRRYPYARCGIFVRIAVIDTGMGMDKQTQSRIFEPFFTTKKDKGSGLGLAMCYGLIKNHKGWINFQSEPGIGTTFVIYLPAIKATVAERPCKVPKLCDMPRGNEAILLIDDTETVLFCCRDMLEGLGYRVLMARDGHEAYDIYEQNRDKLSLVITDLVMPRCGGRELLKQLRSNGHQVPVLLASGYAITSNSTAEIEQEGFSGFVPKPFRIASLASAVRSVLDAHV